MTYRSCRRSSKGRSPSSSWSDRPPVPSPCLPVVGRSGRDATSAVVPASRRGFRRPRPPWRYWAQRLDRYQDEHRALHRSRRPRTRRRRTDRDARQCAGVGSCVQSADGVLVLGAAGTLRCVVAEVHNTYGERHAYVLTLNRNGGANADKQFYVSPFNDVSGHYSMRFTLTEQIVRVSVSLLRSDQPVFEAEFWAFRHRRLRKRSPGSRSACRGCRRRSRP